MSKQITEPNRTRNIVIVSVAIAGIVAVVLGLAFSSILKIPGITHDKENVPAGFYLGENESTAVFDENWKPLQKSTTITPWFIFSSFNGSKEYFINPMNYTEFQVNPQVNNTLNNPVWKKYGLDYNVALIFVNSMYKIGYEEQITEGTVILLTGSNVWNVGVPYIIVCDLRNFDAVAASKFFTVKFI